MAQAILRLVDGAFMDRSKAPNAVLSQMACAFGNDSNIGRGNSEGMGFATMEASGPEAELFALAEKVESAEKAFHDAVLCRNEAQIAYLRDPSIMTLQSLDKSKTAEAAALERFSPIVYDVPPPPPRANWVARVTPATSLRCLRS